MRTHLRYMAALLCAVLCATGMSVLRPAVAEASPPPESWQVGAAYLSCLSSNTVLYEKNTQAILYPASTVKIMSGLIVCRCLADRMDEVVTLSAGMLSGVTGRSLHLAAGEVLTIRDLMYAALCGSYNDAFCVLAVLSYGSVADFVTQMNREAARLGASSTRYTNPTGIHDDAMVTTLGDTVLIAREAYRNELYMFLTSASSYTISATDLSEERNIYNRNALLSDTSQNYRNGYCRGMSAGMTDEGGWCVVTVCERGGAALLCVVMQGADVDSGELIPAYVYTNSLLSWARQSYGYVDVLAPGAVLDTVSVGMTGLSSSKTTLTVPDGLSVYLPLDVNPETDLSITYTLTDGSLTAPLTAGERVGMVTAFYHGEVVGTAALTVTEDFTENAFLGGMASFQRYLVSRPFFATLICFVVLLLLYLRRIHRTHGRYKRWRYVRRRMRRRHTRRPSAGSNSAGRYNG